MEIFVDRQIPSENIRVWLAGYYGISPSTVVAYQEGATEVDGGSRLAIRIETVSSGDFPLDLEIEGAVVRPKGRSDEVSCVQAFCRHFNCQALTSDEDVNPYTWVLTDQHGECWWVSVDADLLDDQNGFVVTAPCRAPEGSFWASRPIDTAEARKAVAVVLEESPDTLDIQVDPLSREDSASPYERHYPIIGGEHYRFLFTVRVSRTRRRWMPNACAAQEWVEHMVRAANALKIPVCIFHNSFSVAKTIPGGSDAEEHCYYWDGQNARRVVYKPRRPSW